MMNNLTDLSGFALIPGSSNPILCCLACTIAGPLVSVSPVLLGAEEIRDSVDVRQTKIFTYDDSNHKGRRDGVGRKDVRPSRTISPSLGEAHRLFYSAYSLGLGDRLIDVKEGPLQIISNHQCNLWVAAKIR
jgi:hypothetical protein